MTKRKRRRKMKFKALLIILLIPVAMVILTLSAIIFASIKNPDVVRKSAHTIIEWQGGMAVPNEYIPIYQAAAEEYDIPWTLLAAHHRIETRFSTMDPLLSPAGAEGHMQFMPCTFVGWTYPGCDGLGEGEIPEEDKTNPEVIKEHGGYGVDANGDGIADPYDIEDAIFSAANYLSQSGAAHGEYEKAIFDYNRSEKYVADVLYYFNAFEESKDELEANIR